MSYNALFTMSRPINTNTHLHISPPPPLRPRSGATAVADVTAQISSTINNAAAVTAHIFLGFPP